MNPPSLSLDSPTIALGPNVATLPPVIDVLHIKRFPVLLHTHILGWSSLGHSCCRLSHCSVITDTATTSKKTRSNRNGTCMHVSSYSNKHSPFNSDAIIKTQVIKDSDFMIISGYAVRVEPHLSTSHTLLLWRAFLKFLTCIAGSCKNAIIFRRNSTIHHITITEAARYWHIIIDSSSWLNVTPFSGQALVSDQ